jgi:hypothetical protein
MFFRFDMCNNSAIEGFDHSQTAMKKQDLYKRAAQKSLVSHLVETEKKISRITSSVMLVIFLKMLF